MATSFCTSVFLRVALGDDTCSCHQHLCRTLLDGSRHHHQLICRTLLYEAIHAIVTGIFVLLHSTIHAIAPRCCQWRIQVLKNLKEEVSDWHLLVSISSVEKKKHLDQGAVLIQVSRESRDAAFCCRRLGLSPQWRWRCSNSSYERLATSLHWTRTATVGIHTFFHR